MSEEVITDLSKAKAHVEAEVQKQDAEKRKKENNVERQMWASNPMKCDIAPVNGRKFRDNYDRIFGKGN